MSKTTKTLRTICLTLTLLLGSVGTSWGADNEISEKVIKYFESEKESLVIKAFWTSQDTLNLTAINNNNISTYSILACAKLRDIGFSTKDIQLRIIDHRRYESDGSINVLNEFFCKKKGPKVLYDSPTQTPPSENVIIQQKVPDKEVIVKLFKSDKELIARDAAWTSDNVFKVGVADNGTNMDGYAEYICLTLRHLGYFTRDISVYVIDYFRLIREDKWINLGKYFCKKREGDWVFYHENGQLWFTEMKKAVRK